MRRTRRESLRHAGGVPPMPGFWETLKEDLLGARRPMECVQVEVTSRCPGRCTYCPHTILKDRWISRDMDMEVFTHLWPMMRRATRVHLQGWGEPLLHPDFFSMTALARRAGCRISTTTCGLRMDERIALDIVRSGVDIVAFSLAGTDAKSNAPRRGVDFDRVCDAVSILQTVRKKRMGVHLEIHFAYLMLASDMEAVRGLPALMRRLGVHAAVVSTLDYLPDQQLSAQAVMPGDAETIARAAAVLGETAEEAKRLDVDFHYELPPVGRFGGTCRENVDRSVFVSVDGSVSPCVYVNVPVEGDDSARRVFGSIRERDPVEIWESESYGKFRADLAGGHPDGLCRTCPKRRPA